MQYNFNINIRKLGIIRHISHLIKKRILFNYIFRKNINDANNICKIKSVLLLMNLNDCLKFLDVLHNY